MIRHFHEFFKSKYLADFDVRPNCVTAGVQLHGVTQSAGAPALPPSAKPEVSAEQRACGAPLCVCRGERNLSRVAE